MANALEGKLVTGTSDDARVKIYLVEGGQKRWIVSPEAFEEHGWHFADVVTVTDAELHSIPTSPNDIGADLQFASRDEARFRVSAAHLAGRGIEIGAGMNPQPLPEGVRVELFELRPPQEVARMFGADAEAVPAFFGLEEIRTRYPAGADFLIAHNVLEHCPDAIGTLLEWIGHVRDGGTLVVSVPCAEYCPDRGRLVPDLEHVLLDHLLERSADRFESREHAYSCTMGWMNDWPDWLAADKVEVAERAHEKAHMPDLDVHFHAHTPELFDALLQATAHLCERSLTPLDFADPYLEGESATGGDIIAVLRVGGDESAGASWRFESVAKEIARIEGRLRAAVARLGPA